MIGAEHPHLRATQIDLDEDTDAEQLAQQLLRGSEEDETGWRNGRWYTARLCPTPLRPEERRTTVVNHKRDGMRLQIRTPGDLESMELAAYDRIPPGPGQIEVAVTASSINFADVLVAFGRYPSFEGRLPQTGTDFAGVVTAVGPDVTTHQVGDHVGGISANGCWGTFVTCDARLAVTLPTGLADGQAAAVTTAHATAWYGLHDLARIDRGDRVLIHSATGGVGQAAIAIARDAGAEIFATAGSQQRRELLRDMGIEHVYDSRSIEFAEQIRRDTDGYGVDIVLNSVTGAAQRAGLELLALGGRFVEIGKRDIYGDTRLGLFPFRRNLTFYAVDLGLLSISHPEKVRNLLDTVYRLTADGVLPLPESTHYPLADAATAIRMMGAAQHTGKLVLDIPRTGSGRVVVPPQQARVFRGDGAYIITGGLGGLGLFLAEKMATAGCGRIVLSSRSQPTLKGAGDHRAHPLDRRRRRGAVRRYRRTRHCGTVGGSGNGDRACGARRAARRGGGRRRHAEPTSPMSSSIGTGRPRSTAHGTCTPPRPPSRWTGSARSPRRPRWSARPGRARMRRPTAGWTPSPTGAAPRAFRPPRSPGEHGPRSAAPRRWPKAPTPRSLPTKVRMRSRPCCATTAPTPGTPR